MSVGPLQIMLVEDEPLVAMSVSELVGTMGLTIAGPFRTNADAATYLAHHDPIIAIVDYGLGTSTALETANALCMRRVPFIVLSGYGRDVTSNPAFADVEWVTKPFSEAQFYDAFDRCLHRAGLAPPFSARVSKVDPATDPHP